MTTQAKGKARRIARTVREQGYTLDQALAEARGQVVLPEDRDGAEAARHPHLAPRSLRASPRRSTSS